MKSAATNKASALDRIRRGPFGVSSTFLSTARIGSPWRKRSRGFCSFHGMIASASLERLSRTTSLPLSVCCTSPESSSVTSSENSSLMRSRSLSRTICTIRCLTAMTAFRPKSLKSTGTSITSPTSKVSSSQRASSSNISLAGSSTSATTRRSTTISNSPVRSSIAISAWTVVP